MITEQKIDASRVFITELLIFQFDTWEKEQDKYCDEAKSILPQT